MVRQREQMEGRLAEVQKKKKTRPSWTPRIRVCRKHWKAMLFMCTTQLGALLKHSLN